MIIYLCRHGNRNPNGPDRVAPVQLTPRGHDQARRLGRWLEKQDVGAVYSSPKRRAVQTALPLCDYAKLPLEVWPCLIEHDSYGPLDFDVVHVLDGAPFYSVYNGNMLLKGTGPQEDLSGAYRRACFALGRLRESGREKIAVFAHDCFNSVFVWAWLGRGPQTEADRYRQDECCVNVLEDGRPPRINLKVDPDI